MTMLVHLSDPHFGTEVPEVMEAIKRRITALAPNIAVVSGDITQRARPEQFEAAAAFVAWLPAQTKLVIPGNHDIPLYNLPVRLLRPYENYRAAFKKRETVAANGNIALVGFDATSPLRHTRGNLSTRQIKRGVALARAEAGDDALLIACAHQPLQTALAVDADEALIDAPDIAHTLSEQKVDLILSGHVHYPLITTTRAGFPDLPRAFVLAGAGTAMSHRIRSGAPNSFNAIEIDSMATPRRITITMQKFDKAKSEFVTDIAQQFVLQSDGWWQQD